jgi:Icc-related predicted phosphoesterase
LKIWAVNDLHIRLSEARSGHSLFPAIPDADVCVIAGDICDRMVEGMDWIGRVIAPHMPVVMVLGNHDLFGQDMPAARRQAPVVAARNGITLLDDSSAVIGGVRFVGGTLWTDFAIFDALPDSKQHSVDDCMRAAKSGMPDYEEIYATEVTNTVMARFLNPRDTLGMHRTTRAFIDAELATPFDGETVVVTHHAPYPRSVHQLFLESVLTGAFVSDLSDVIERHQPRAWFHGHTHHSFRYHVGRTEFVCNPRGPALVQNFHFDPSLVIEV